MWTKNLQMNLQVLLIRHAEDGKKYLYDMVNIKKETEYTA